MRAFSGGCVVTDTLRLTIKDCICKLTLPNVFTPDGNGINDHFRPHFECELTAYTFRVFNRWGRQVFFSHNPDEAWDGKVHTRESAEGVYYWFLDYEALSQEQRIKETRKGIVHLVRQ